MQTSDIDTIAAIATPSGYGGVGIVRVSGSKAKEIAQAVLNASPAIRKAVFSPFWGEQSVIDEGIALFFKAPHSFTGEDVLELQGHGGPIVLDRLLKRVVSLGARLAKPGEFSERAFLNNKLDLVQVEAIADLIHASSQQAAEAAVMSLRGAFSFYVYELVEKVIQLRLYIEAAIDFPEEEIDFLKDASIFKSLNELIDILSETLKKAEQGAILSHGCRLAIIGEPNAGKSSLLNQLTDEETAIVSDIPGTTRDVIQSKVMIDGVPFHIADTAGLRQTTDIIEQEGIKRAWQAVKTATCVLIVIDVSQNKQINPYALYPEWMEKIKNPHVIVVCNKIDKCEQPSYVQEHEHYVEIGVSAKHGEGIALLRGELKKIAGINRNVEDVFIARRRHLVALEKAKKHLLSGLHCLETSASGELLAEELKITQDALSDITGEFSSDDLLGRIFSEFCIGK